MDSVVPADTLAVTTLSSRQREEDHKEGAERPGVLHATGVQSLKAISVWGKWSLLCIVG